MRAPDHLTSRCSSRAGIGLAMLAVLLACADAAEAKRAPRMRKPKHGVQIKVGPVVVPRGEEVTECTYLKLPSRKDMNVNKIEMRVSGGSHHIHLYRPHDPTLELPDGHETCNMALDFSVWQLILADQSPRLRWRLPPGVAFHFKGGEQLAAQTHFVDTGLLSTDGEGFAVMNLHAMPSKKVRAYAGAIFGQDRDVLVPPGTTSNVTTRCVFPQPVKLLGITGHYHFRGVRFTAAGWDGVQTGTELYRQDGYLEPAFRRFTTANAPEVHGIEWTCSYENPTSETYKFGPFTEENEHCNLFAFYYPTTEPHEVITCVQEQGVATVTVRGN